MKPTYQDALAYFGVSGAHPGGLTLTKFLLEQEKITEETTLLDGGCGTGQTAAYIKKNYPCSVTGIDYHPTMVKRANKRFEKEHISIQLVQGSLEKMPFPSDSFDIILVESVLIFTNCKNSLAEIKRVLKPGGVLLLVEMTAERALYAMEHQNMCEVYGIEKVYTEKEWINLMKEAGFPKVEVTLGHSVFSHMMTGMEPEDEAIDTSVPVNMQLEGKLMDHSYILYTYGNIIGYRVYRASL
ncbi:MULTISPECIES: class I SAM-dependent methyltransferase [Bacillaceae]|uniref:Class I SAM-dependent methyltransferase n=1 Tax=Niallia hominis TaxID=3133173 RepID=A0ABV1F3F6_9BACI|nr:MULTISPECIES: class I SAM-dependent methyltransferase [Bacillaceae]MCF2648777.1 class I SAM-dependent methyltransferase [Niallia circulans]CAI9396308.1 2-methoxy-6-polyprenyl-1,4-benzoquinol methylase, mitochondrial [Bacillus sp. T2.9-1]